MGWYYTQGTTRKQLIAELTAPEESSEHRRETIASCARGNVLWSVVQVERPTAEPVVYIACDLMQRQRNYGWGHKPLEEACHPYYYTCPLSYLELAPVACDEWRTKVREYHARRSRHA